MTKITTKEQLAEHVSTLPSVQNEAFAEILKEPIRKVTSVLYSPHNQLWRYECQESLTD